MNYLQKNFIFLSQIIGIHVIDAASGSPLGRVVDIIASLREMYPRAVTLVVGRPLRRGHRFIPWSCVKRITEEQAVFVECPSEEAAAASPGENEVLLKETLWDRQIVDISGSKVVRVNDLHLLRENRNLWVVHVDVGFKALLRRLGWLRPAGFLVRWLFSYELKDRFISWKFVQPATTQKGRGLLSLKTPGMKLAELHPADLADIMVDLGIDERAVILRSLDTVSAANTLKELPLKIRVQMAATLPVDQLSPIVNEMPMDEAVDLLGNFPKKKATALFACLPVDKVAQIKGLLEMSERVAGSIMNTEYIAEKQTATIGRTLEKIRTEARRKESIYYIYTLDDNDALIGIVTVRQLLTLPADKTLSEIMRKRIVKVRVDTDIKKVAEIFYKYDFSVVPVVDRQNHLQGIITMKDALESVFPEIREETEEIS
jgi:CBS domain-containing protein/sporulation protein YlmC with PRC-barrel domain